MIEIARSRREATELIRTRFWLAVSMIVGVLLSFFFFNASLATRSQQRTELSGDVAQSTLINNLMLERLALLRAFILTGESDYLLRESANRIAVETALDSLRADLRNSPEQLRVLDSAEAAIRDWDSAFAEPAATTAPDAATRLGAVQQIGRVQYEPVREALAALSTRLAEDLAEHVRGIQRLRTVQLIAISAGLLILLGALVRFRALIMGKASALEEQQERLEEQAIELEQQQAELEISVEELADAAAEAELARDEAQAALKRLGVETALLASALDSSPLGFAFFDRDLRCLRVNGVMARLGGLPVSEHEGRDAAEMPWNLDSDTPRRLVSVMDSRKPLPGVGLSGEYPDKPGERRNFLQSYFPISSASGELLGAGIVLADITEQMKLEGQLRQSQKMEAIGQLAGGIAHDFNNLLTAILGHNELVLAGGGLSDEVRSDAQQIEKAASQAAALTQKLLAFGRKQVLVPRTVDLGHVATELAPTLRRLIREDIRIELSVDDGLRAVRADPTQVEQILVNLVVNARDAMPDGGKLGIRVRNAELDEDYLLAHGMDGRPGEYVAMEVTDNGVGMDESVKSRAFEPFFTTKESGKGTGLGLATVYGIVKQSGAQLFLYSEPGLGSSFRIFFPAMDGVARGGTGKQEPAVAGGNGERVLLVEDDPAVLKLARRLLERLNYSVTTAINGRDAIDVVDADGGSFDIVVTDVVMPEMGGAALVQELRKRIPELAVVFVSGYAGDDMVGRGILEANAVYVQKPYSSRSLADGILSARQKVRPK